MKPLLTIHIDADHFTENGVAHMYVRGKLYVAPVCKGDTTKQVAAALLTQIASAPETTADGARSRGQEFEAEAKVRIREVLEGLDGGMVRNIEYTSERTNVIRTMSGQMAACDVMHRSEFIFRDKTGATVEVTVVRTVGK